jgi:hypothetical protein
MRLFFHTTPVCTIVIPSIIVIPSTARNLTKRGRFFASLRRTSFARKDGFGFEMKKARHPKIPGLFSSAAGSAEKSA